MAIGDVVRASMVGAIQGSPVVNQLYWQVGQDPSADKYPRNLELANELATRWIDNLLPILSQDYGFVGCTVSDVHPGTGPLAQSTINTDPTLGAVLVDAASNVGSVVVSLISDGVGPAGRGRLFLSGIPQDSCDAGKVIQSFASALDTEIQDILSNITLTLAGDTFVPVVWSEKFTIAKQTTSWIVRPNLGTQRRRRSRQNLYASGESPQ